jgi:hypothetical protein
MLTLVAVTAVLLSACLRVRQDLTLNPDDTIDGSITVAVSQQLIELSGSTADEVIGQLTEEESPIPEGIDAETEPYEQDGYVGTTSTFSGAPLDALNEQGDLTIERQGDVFIVDGSLDLSSGSDQIDPDDPTVQNLMEQFEVELSITFPGEVTEHDGTLDGTTVIWTPAIGQTTSIHAEGSALGGGSSMTWLLIVAGVLLVAGVVVFIVAKGRGGAPAPEEAAPGSAAAAPPLVPAVPEMPPTPPAEPDDTAGSADPPSPD